MMVHFLEYYAIDFVKNLKSNGFPNARWSWTGRYNNEYGYIWIWDESDLRDNWEHLPARYKVLNDGSVVELEPPIIEGVIKEESIKDAYRNYKFGNRKWSISYSKGIDITFKAVFELQRDGSYKLLYVNRLKGNVFSF